MNLVERDAYVIAQLASFVAQGMSATQAANEVLRTSGISFISIPPEQLALSDPTSPTLQSDIIGIKAAVDTISTLPASTPLTRLQQRVTNASGKGKS